MFHIHALPSSICGVVALARAMAMFGQSGRADFAMQAATAGGAARPHVSTCCYDLIAAVA
ncbi:MAG: hypothetical protein EOP64_10190 [Sphingomonas sp.]|jgi:hypothetical protein|nr:MAG: hypothetical protein EOP64_10190 [Sphingomonas sp.]